MGALVRLRRRAAGLSQAELAAMAGVGRRFVAELEGGKASVRLDTTRAVLAVFGLILRPEPRSGAALADERA